MNTTRYLCSCIWAILGILAGSALAQPSFYHHGNIYTMDASRPRAEAMLVEDGLFAAVGSEAEVHQYLLDAGIRVIHNVDLKGQTVVPGLIDAHGHMMGLGALGLGMLDLRNARSFAQVVAMVKKKAESVPEGSWIVGRGWDNASWTDSRLPSHETLSAAVPKHPVWISRVDGHAGLANAKAMELAGVTSATQNPKGGEILRGSDNKPTGVFVDQATSLIGSHIPDGLMGSPAELIENAQQKCLRVGLTGVHDAGVNANDIEVYKKLQQEGRLKIRIYAMVHAKEAPAWFAEHGLYDGFNLTVRAAKAYMDGAMGSRGAWLLKPYADRPTGPAGKPYTGLGLATKEDIEALAIDGLQHGYQVCVHAIGDRANREVLDAYESALKQVGKEDEGASLIADHRFRIEHAQLLTQNDIPRFGTLGVIASMQPTHCTSDMRWVDARVGTERAKGAYAWASLLQSGATLAMGSDFPVESPNPFLGIYAAVTRENAKGEPENGWHPEQRITREEALQGFTIDAAKAAFWDERVGSIKTGKLADFVILDRDIMTCDVGAIVETKVLSTVCFGEVVYQAHQ